MKNFFNILLVILLFFLISSFGFPIIIDLTLVAFISYILKFKSQSLIFVNLLVLIMSIFSNFFLIKNYEKNENFYRAHEKFATDKLNYKKNIKSNMVMPHGDIIAVDYCNKIENLAKPRRQNFITDQNGFRNDKFNINDAEIILVGDSFIAGSSNTQEDIPANIFNKLNKKKVYAITSISGPEYYEYHIKNHLDKLSKNSVILLFYFAGNDFNYEYKNNKNFIYFNDVQIPYLKYKLRFGYERLERNKDKIFIKIFDKIYTKNYFYKKIRPKSQTLTKKILAKWTNTCPVEYHKLKDDIVGFHYKPIKNYTNVSTHIITDEKILSKLKKVYFIPTKYTVYKKYIHQGKIDKTDYNHLKIKYNELGIEVEDLTDILVSAAENDLKNNKLIYWRDDTHWNKNGIYSAMKYIFENL